MEKFKELTLNDIEDLSKNPKYVELLNKVLMMNKKKMYVITMSGGSYDDAWQKTEFITDDEVKGKEYVDRMNSKMLEVNKLGKEVLVFDIELRKKIVAPTLKEFKVIEVPKWDSKIKVTTEMRIERKRIEDLNANKKNEALKPYRDWQNKINEEVKIWMQKNYSKEILSLYEKYSSDNVFFDIEEVQWLKV